VYYLYKGKVASNTTTLVKHNDRLYYVKNGKVASDTTTLVEYNDQYYYVEKGEVSTKTQFVDFEGKTYYVENGVASVKSNGKIIYLTFDDGPGPYTEKLLGVLAKYNVKATFFVCNTGYTHLLDDIVDAGHGIAIHSRTHNYSKIYSSDKAFYEDLYYMQNLIYEKTGVMTYVTRFPGGSSNSISKNYSSGIMSRLTKSMQEKGFRYFDWNVDSKDAGGTKTASGVASNVINGIKNSSRTHHYVLQHDIHSYSVNAVEQIIQWGLSNGYTFQTVTVDSPACHHDVRN
jgi:peptidoglycan/xylan/chitin deacetylase (PgdA/CDA1 family)